MILDRGPITLEFFPIAVDPRTTTGSARLRVDDLDALPAAFCVVGQSPRFCRTTPGVLPIEEAHGLRRRRAKWVRGMPDACEDDLEFVSGGTGVGGSWSLGPLRGKPADKQEKACAAAGADVRIGPALFWIGGFHAHLGLCGVRPEGRAEAADGRGRRLCVWRDATGRSSGPCADPWAGRAGGSGA